MHPVKFPRLALAFLGLAVGFGCTSSDGGGGTGGSPGTGGQSSGTGGSATGGTTATGGVPGTGGITGTGGTATGGITGTGGTATGGVTGTGGTATGGITGTGGTAGGAGHAGGGFERHRRHGRDQRRGGSSGTAFSLTSTELADNAHFASKYTCAESPALSGKTVGNIGNGINPELDWTNPPAGTMSFAMTFLDTTLINMGGSMVMFGEHWAIWNISPTVMGLPEGLTMTLSGGLAGAKQSGTFLAPCATTMNGTMGDEYEFTIYALSTATLSITGTSVDNARTALATAMSSGKVLGTAVLHGYAGKGGL